MVIFAMLILPVIVAASAVYYVWTTAHADDTTRTDAIVVLGAAQYNGTPSPVLRARLQHSLKLYKAGIAPRIVTVGGKQPRDAYTEAGSGRQWLIENGVPGSDVVAIKAGTDTLGSIQDVAELAAREGWSSITLDTDPAHVARSQAMANRVGFDTHVSPTQDGDGSTVTLNYLARESLAYLAFEVLGQWNVPRVVGSSD